jgi:hypothetical protein
VTSLDILHFNFLHRVAAVLPPKGLASTTLDTTIGSCPLCVVWVWAIIEEEDEEN